MDRHFDTELQALKEQLLAMGGMVERAIGAAIDGLLSEEGQVAARIEDLERRINRAHMAVDEACVRLLALQHPFAGDLRFIVASIKINTDLERIGDQAVNIAH